MSVLVPILPGELPPQYCFENWQKLLVDFANNMQAVLAGATFYNIGPTKPAPEFEAYPWLRTIDYRWYVFDGDWISAANHDPNERRLFVGTTVDLQTYDGGDTGAASDRSGPMWEVDTAFEGRSPMGPGALAGSDPAKILALDEDYGAASLVMAMAQMPAHKHTYKAKLGGIAGAGYPVVSGNSVDNNEDFETEEVGGADPVQLTHPVRGIYFIKPTSRIYYRI